MENCAACREIDASATPSSLCEHAQWVALSSLLGSHEVPAISTLKT